MTREPEIFKRLYLKHIPGQTNKDWFILSVPIGYSKQTSQVQFDPDNPILAYQQHDQNSCCMSILASVLEASNEFVAANSIAARISSSLTDAIPDRIQFESLIMSDQARNFGE